MNDYCKENSNCKCYKCKVEELIIDTFGDKIPIETLFCHKEGSYVWK